MFFVSSFNMLIKFVIRIFCNLIVLVIFSSSIASASFETIVNEKVITLIDVSSQLVIVNNKVTFKNQFTKPIDSYLFVVDPQWMHNLSYIEAIDERENSLNVNRVYTDDTWLKFEILFHETLSPNQTEDIIISSIFINYLQSYPKSVKQYEKHFVLFSFNVYFYSLYFTEEQTTFLYLGTNEVTSVDGAMYKIADDTNHALKYGPYLKTLQMSEHPSIIHYQNSSPFLTVEKLKRFIQISHWGFITVREHISLVHTGPKLKGPYERHKKDNINSSPDTKIESFVTTLPGDSFDIYLKDEIGKIWSFSVDDSSPHKVEVKIRPRFVMYGGWKTQYEMGYTLPISNYIGYHNDSMFTLSIPIINRLFQNMVISEAEVNIILPEGATFEDINPYYELENDTENRYCYLLDVLCREVVSFKMYNLVERHGSNVSLTYTYPQLLLLTKPLTIIIILFLVFLSFVILTHKTSHSLEINEASHTVTNRESAKQSGKQKNQLKIKCKKT